MTSHPVLQTLLVASGLLAAHSSHLPAQDLVVTAGDLLIRDSSTNQIILLDHASSEVSVGGSGTSGTLLLMDDAGTTRALLSAGNLSLRKTSGFSTLTFDANQGDVEAGGGAVDGDLVLKTSSNIPTILLDGATGEVEIFDGGGTGIGDRVYRLEIDSSSADHWGDTRAANSDYTLRANDDFELYLDQAGSGDLTSGSFKINNNSGTEVFSIDENGNVSASGTKSAVVDTEDHGRVKLYAVESTENWFEDFGSSTLARGVATVDLDPVFVETVNSTETYYVTLTPACNEPVLLFVSDKREDSFVAQGVTLSGGPSDCSFDYRITAKRKGYEDIRLERMEQIEAHIWAVERGL